MYQENYTQNQVNLSNKLRKLWEQHVMWTRSFIISVAHSLPDLDEVTARLLQNPVDFGAALKPYYGEMKSKMFTDLLTQHLKIGGDLVKASKAGETMKANDLRNQWYANADEIAKFLSEINPFWDRGSWQKMMYDHLGMTEDEAGKRLHSQYREDIKEYEFIEHEALQMADYMAEGLIKQFEL